MNFRKNALPMVRKDDVKNIQLNHLLTGKITLIGERKTPSGINKQTVNRKLFLGKEGFEGDEQGDKKHHGGPDKAIHHYPFEHYALWMKEIATNSILNSPGAFGENFSTTGLDETNVALGDVFRIGTALIEVSQGRQPCWKLNARFGVNNMALRVQQNGRTGWYYRVLEEGYIEPGETFTRINRHTPEWPLYRLWKILYVDMLNYNELEAMATLQNLPDGWRHYAQKRLKTRKIEDWSKRLEGDH